MTAALLLAALAVELQPPGHVYNDPTRTFDVSIRVSSDGLCIGGADVDLDAGSGEVVELHEIAPGTFHARWKPGKAGTTTLRVTATRGEERASAEAELRVDPVANVHVHVEPAKAHLRNAEGARTTVEIRAEGASDLDTPAVATTTGTVTRVRKSADGVWVATLRAPAQRYPQVSIVSVTFPARPDIPSAFTSIAWEGRISLPVETEPGSTVVARAGGAATRPVRADSRGRATIQLPVRPGVYRVEIESTDTLGNETRTFSRIDPPAFPKTALVARRLGAVAPDGTAAVLIEAFAVDATGRTVPPAGHLEAQGPDGEAGPLSEGGGPRWVARVAAGVGGRASFRLRAGTATRAEAVVDVPAAPPVALRIDAEPEALQVGAGSTVTVRARLVDGAGRTLPAGGIELSAEGAELGTPERDAGVVRAVLTARAARIPDGGHARVRATARGGRGCTASTALDVPVHAGPPARVRFVSPPAIIQGGVDGRTRMTVEVTDAGGNPVADAAPTADGTGPLSVEPPEATDGGRYRMWVSSSGLGEPQEEEIRVTAGDAHATVRVQVLPSPRDYSAALHAGASWNLGALVAPGIDVEAERRVGHPRLRVAARVGFGYGRGADPTNGLESVQMFLGRAAVHVRWYVWSEQRPVSLSVSGGPEATLVRSRLEQMGGNNDSWTTALGGGISVEGGRRLGNGFVVLEGGYSLLQAAGDVRGNVGGLRLGVGYRYGF